MTTRSVFIWFRKTDFNIILACFKEGNVYRWCWVVWSRNFCFRKKGVRRFFVNFEPPPPAEESDSPCASIYMYVQW